MKHKKYFVSLSLDIFHSTCFVTPLSVSVITTPRPNQRVNINLARIKVLINCEPSKLHSTRAEYTV